ncbi:MAG: 2,3-bisphosphoglycerate-independent phosphoglycerate mutase [Candidatus Hydrothermarchaeaceae archaeon]
MKACIVVFDGMADRPIKELGDKTPLEVAATPTLNALARKGINGLLDPIAPGVRVGSDTTHLAILGYDPYKIYSGRGPFEALGVGMKLEEGDIALRCNFATVGEDGRVLDRRAGRISDGTVELAQALNTIEIGREFVFKESVGHRGVLILKGKGKLTLSPEVTDSDPHTLGEKIQEVKPLDSSKEGTATANFLNAFSRKALEVLGKHDVNMERAKVGLAPANAILMRGCGRAAKVEPFLEKHGARGACMASVGIINGIAVAAGMDVLNTPSPYAARVKKALKVLNEYDVVILNIKEADEASHDHNFEKKIRIIEEIDSALAPVIDFIEQNYVALLCDHTTSVSYGDHTGDPVPITIAGPEVRSDGVVEFDERSAPNGGLCRIRGIDIMPILMDLMNRSEKFGA